MWDRERLKESHGSLMGGLVLVTDRAGLNKVMCVFLHSGPPETLEEDISCVLGTWVAGELGGMGPLQGF